MSFHFLWFRLSVDDSIREGSRVKIICSGDFVESTLPEREPPSTIDHSEHVNTVMIYVFGVIASPQAGARSEKEWAHRCGIATRTVRIANEGRLSVHRVQRCPHIYFFFFFAVDIVT